MSARLHAEGEEWSISRCFSPFVQAKGGENMTISCETTIFSWHFRENFYNAPMSEPPAWRWHVSRHR